MRKHIRRFLKKCHKNGTKLTGWSYFEIASTIVREGDLDYPVMDVANELVQMTIAKEIDFE